MTHVVTQSCCNDATCVSACPVNCIHPTPDEPGYSGAEMLYIDPRTCIDCGACIDACPVDAIVPDYDLTDATERYLDINARYFADPAHQDYPETPSEKRVPPVEVTASGPLRVAIVGSGPAACYAAEDLLSRPGLDVEVHLFERLPTPWGLVRFGVAPDHQRTKAVTKLFTRTAGRSGLHFHLNVEVGEHVTHQELLEHHHAVIFAVGAASDRKLEVPGADLAGHHSATDFVAWYNGHPDFAEQSFDLSGERAMIIGNGNVALDIARVLASDVDRLTGTDIADHALEALAESRIREIVVLGRRGPAQAAFTTPELLGLVGTPGIDVSIDVQGTTQSGEPNSMAELKADIVRELSERTPSGTGRQVVLRFLSSPVELVGERGAVRGIRVVRNELVDRGDGRIEARATSETEDIACGLVLRSIGYQGVAIPGLPFDQGRGTLPHSFGRVVDPADGKPVLGVYATGWIKRGPSGVIGTNKKCAEETVQALLDDYTGGRLAAPEKDGEALLALLAERQPNEIGYSGWKAIDRHERSLARPHGRPRVKLVGLDDMLHVADGRSGP